MRDIDTIMLPEIIVTPDDDYDLFKGSLSDTPIRDYHKFFDLPYIQPPTGVPANLGLVVPSIFSKNLRDFIGNYILANFAEFGLGKDPEKTFTALLKSIAEYVCSQAFIYPKDKETINILCKNDLSFSFKYVANSTITMTLPATFIREEVLTFLNQEYIKLKAQLLEFEAVKSVPEPPADLSNKVDFGASLYLAYNALNLYYKSTEKSSNPATSLDMMRHYWSNTGEALDLSDLGLNDIVASLVRQNGELGKPDNQSVHSDFQQQIANGERLHFKQDYDFGVYNPYNALWAIGGATISGAFEFDHFSTGEEPGTYYAIGTIKYNFYDRFSDAYDLFNVIEMDVDIFGTPYDITGKWSEKVQIIMNQEQYLKLKKLITNTPN